jgi:hypothetical protein
MTWVAAADFRRAGDDKQRSLPCQDYGKVEHIGDSMMVGAVASGAPNAAFSHIGARLAVRAALDYLQRHATTASNATDDPTGDAARSLYSNMISAIRDQLRTAASDQVAPLRAFAATLSVFVATPASVAAMKIGRGLIVSRGQSGDYSLVFSEGPVPPEAQSGYITDPDPTEAMTVSVKDGPVDFLFAASTPLDRLPARNRKGAPQKAFFGPLDLYASTAPDDGEVHRSIRTFLRSDRIHDRLDHDVALALCGFRRQGDLFRRTRV